MPLERDFLVCFVSKIHPHVQRCGITLKDWRGLLIFFFPFLLCSHWVSLIYFHFEWQPESESLTLLIVIAALLALTCLTEPSLVCYLLTNVTLETTSAGLKCPGPRIVFCWILIQRVNEHAHLWRETPVTKVAFAMNDVIVILQTLTWDLASPLCSCVSDSLLLWKCYVALAFSGAEASSHH